MGVRIITGHEAGSTRELAVLFCSTDGRAFGPVFGVTHTPGRARDALDTAEAFLRWCDARGIDDVRRLEPAALEALAVEWSIAGSP